MLWASWETPGCHRILGRSPSELGRVEEVWLRFDRLSLCGLRATVGPGAQAPDPGLASRPRVAAPRLRGAKAKWSHRNSLTRRSSTLYLGRNGRGPNTGAAT